MARGRRLFGQLVLVLVVMTSAFVGAKLGLLGTREVGASHNFTDVPDGAFFHDFVDFLVDTGITAGCGPLLYCPERAVTRGEQAVFLRKFLAVGSMPQVVDANGRLVGRTMAVLNESSATVAISLQNRLVFVQVNSAGFQLSPSSGLFYPGVSDCTGQGFFTFVGAFAGATVSKVMAPGRTVYVPDLANPTVFSATPGSSAVGGFPPCLAGPFTGTGHPAIPVGDLDVLFQPPLGVI